MTTSPNKEKPVKHPHREVPLTDGLYWLVVLTALIAALAFWPSPARAADPPAPPFAQVVDAFRAQLYVDRDLVRENARLRAKNHRLHRSLTYHGKLVRRLQGELRNTYSPVWYALKLASAAFAVPFWELHAVGTCESHLWPFATNGRYRGLFQEGPMFEAGPFGRAGFSVWDPVANAMTAGYTVHQQGWRQWECKP